MLRPAILNGVFIDSQGWMALMNPRDQAHQAATVAYQEIITNRYRIYTTTWTLYDALSHIKERDKNGGYEAAVRLQNLLRHERVVEVLRVTEELEEKALRRFWGYRDKRWSITTCANVEAMAQRGLVYVMSANNAYREAGFTSLVV